MALTSSLEEFQKLQDFKQALAKIKKFRAVGIRQIPETTLLYWVSIISGTLLLPQMDGYAKATGQLPEGEGPDLIIYCAHLADVRVALKIAKDYGWTVVCRAGGHSTAGFSSGKGMIIDVSLMNGVSVDPNTKRMKVGAGAKAGHINKILDCYHLHIPGGGCSTVGIAGYMQGGGYGFTSRSFGMNCDSVVEVSVMLADGSLVTANEQKNEDLFWAIRGGTGGNFGVLLEITYQLYDLHQVWGFAIHWSLEDSSGALVELQTNFMKNSKDFRVNYLAVFATVATSDGHERNPALVVLGMYLGTPEEGRHAIAPLLKTEGAKYIYDEVSRYAELNDTLLKLLNQPKVKLSVFKQCGYIEEPVEATNWQALAAFFSTTPNPYNMMVIEPYGGEINQISRDSNAFIHRQVYMDLYVNSYYDSGGDVTTEDKARQWFESFVTLAEPLYNGHRYQNYPVRNFPNYRWAYWGDAFNSLLYVKNKFDPNHFFTFEQSITPYPPTGGGKQSDTPSRFNNPEIDF